MLSFDINRQMFNGKGTTTNSANIPPVEPLGYRNIEPEKGGGDEPFFAGSDKSGGGPDAWGYNWIDSDDPEGSYLNRLLPIKLALELVYVDEKSIIYDLKIIARTIKVIAQIVLGKTEFEMPPEYQQALAKGYV